jgi:hypothetical protein
MKAAVLVVFDYVDDNEQNREGREADLKRLLSANLSPLAKLRVVNPDLTQWLEKELD